MGKNTNNPTGQIANAETQQPPATQEEKKQNKEMTKAAEAWATELRTPSWQLAALKQHMAIADGKALTRSEFDAGISAAINKRAGSR